jgi:hypothetical protein
MKVAIIPSYKPSENQWLNSLINDASAKDIEFAVFSDSKFWSGDRATQVFVEKIKLLSTFYQKRVNDVYCCLEKLASESFDLILNNAVVGNIPLSLFDVPIVVPLHESFDVTEVNSFGDLKAKNVHIVANSQDQVDVWSSLNFTKVILDDGSAIKRYINLFNELTSYSK